MTLHIYRCRRICPPSKRVRPFYNFTQQSYDAGDLCTISGCMGLFRVDSYAGTIKDWRWNSGKKNKKA